MASSGVTNYTVNERDVILAAASKIGVLERGQDLDAADLLTFRRNLNMIVKQWVGQADFAPGLKMWTRRRAYLFLQKDQTTYSLGPSGDECASETYVTATLTANAAAVSTTLTLTSVSGIANGSRIGVLLDSGTLFWTTVNGAPSGASVTLTDPLPGSASLGARVFAYQTKPLRPFEITTAVIRDTDGNDTPMDPNMSIDEYEAIPVKSARGTPRSMYFEAKKTNSVVYLDCSPEDLTKVIRLVFLSYIEDSTAQTDDADFPAEWFRALVGQLALDSAIDFSRPVTPELVNFRNESLKMAQDAYPSTSDAYYQPHADDYFIASSYFNV